MEDDKVGKFCTISICRQKDWLPINCKYCSKTFCAEHYSIQSHHCPQYHKQYKKVFTCPLCNKLLKLNPHLTQNENFQIHEATECQKDYSKNQKKVILCQGKRCNTKLTEINKFTCKCCVKNLCPKHRLQEAHDCRVFA